MVTVEDERTSVVERGEGDHGLAILAEPTAVLSSPRESWTSSLGQISDNFDLIATTSTGVALRDKICTCAS
ncbi:hypothetical protein ACWGE0_25965 [Lentzea sp. NPDC054927]